MTKVSSVPWWPPQGLGQHRVRRPGGLNSHTALGISQNTILHQELQQQRITLCTHPPPCPPNQLDRLAAEGQVLLLPFHLAHDRHRQPTAQKQHATRHREQSWFNRVRIKLISEQKSQNDWRGQVCQLSFTASFYTPAARFTLDRYGTGKMCAGIEITRFNVHKEQNTNQTRYDLHIVHKVPLELVQLEQLVI